MEVKFYHHILSVILGLILLIAVSPAFAQDSAEVEIYSSIDEPVQTPDEWSAALERVPEVSRESVAEALEFSGANIDALLNVLMSCPDEWLPGAIFLIENMPTEDLTIVSEEMFMDNLRYAYEVRATFPWTEGIFESVFLHYVLPMRVSQEPLENWRGYFLEQLRPRVEGLTRLDDVALEVNRWCGEHVGFQPTQRRDQGPFETLASGYGRCEEMMIVYIDACRAVGIPARHAGTPYWGFCDNNHAWTEVLGEDGNWHYVGACEPRDQLDDAWFNASVRRANLIRSAVFGLLDPDTPNIYRINDVPGARYSVINTIGFYRPSTQLTINVVDIDGVPSPDTRVFLYVFNFGALRPIARGDTDENGAWTTSVGPGGFLISAGDQTSGSCEVLQVEETDHMEITLCLGLGAELPPESFWLRFPYPEEESQ